MHALINF